MINVKLFLEIRRAILAEPRRIDMNRPLVYLEACGTMGCIAGWACILDMGLKDGNPLPRVEMYFPQENIHHNGSGSGWKWAVDWAREDGVEQTAIRILGLSDNEADDLFDFSPRIPAGSAMYAEQVAAKIDAFLASKGHNVSDLLEAEPVENVLNQSDQELICV